MRLSKLIVAAATAWALWSAPAGVALAHGHHGSEGHHAQKSTASSNTTKSVSAKSDGNKAKKPVSDCCTPAAKPAAKKSESATKRQDCCTPAPKAASKCADNAACGGACKTGSKAACKGDCKGKAKTACKGDCKGKAKTACKGDCEGKAKTACKGDCEGKAKTACKGDCNDKPKAKCCVDCCRKTRGWGKYLGGRKAVKTANIRYMPALAGATNQHIVFSTEGNRALTPNFSVGGQFNHALQIGQAASSTPWYTPYGGFLPKVGASIGPVRADLGALLGGGAMFRTTTLNGVSGILEARLIWAVEPRLDFGMKFDHGTIGLTAGYLLTSQQAEFGGPTVGLRWSWKHRR